MIVNKKSTLFLCFDTYCANYINSQDLPFYGGAILFPREPKLGLVLADVILFTCLKLHGLLFAYIPCNPLGSQFLK